MAGRRIPQITERKQPRQARSSNLVAAVLTAAVQVLVEEGAPRFTMARVAERAGVSVGSLYQYFPNKAAVLFRLQSEEWRRTSALLRAILAERERPPLARLRLLVHAFVNSECEEAAVRTALGDAAPLYRDAPEAQEARAAADDLFGSYMREVLPDSPDHVRRSAGDLIEATLSEGGRRFSEKTRTPTDIATHAGMMADMLCAYLDELMRGERPRDPDGPSPREDRATSPSLSTSR